MSLDWIGCWQTTLPVYFWQRENLQMWCFLKWHALYQIKVNNFDKLCSMTKLWLYDKVVKRMKFCVYEIYIFDKVCHMYINQTNSFNWLDLLHTHRYIHIHASNMKRNGIHNVSVVVLVSYYSFTEYLLPIFTVIFTHVSYHSWF